jgi:VWFA-related protein
LRANGYWSQHPQGKSRVQVNKPSLNAIYRRMRAGCGLALLAALFSAPARPGPAPQITIRSTTTVVLIPALVETKNGKIVYGLTAKDFVVSDNGAAQAVKVDSGADTAPFSVVVAIQCGREAAAQFSKFRHLGIVLDSMMGTVPHQMAIVTFDSHPSLLQDFTADSNKISSALSRLEPGDDGAAIRDAVSYSIYLLSRQPRDDRRVLLLISETRDHGSRTTTVTDLLQRVAENNIAIYSLAFSPALSSVMTDLHGQYEGPEFTLLEPLQFAVNAMRRNAASTVSKISGGEYLRFNSARRLDEQFTRLTNHLHGRYVLSFQPKDPMAGYHAIQVHLQRKPHDVVIARTGYWATADGELEQSP